MKVAIAGGGNVGVYIAQDLKQAGHEVLWLDGINERMGDGRTRRTSTVRRT